MLPNDQLADGGPSVTRELPDSVAGPHHSTARGERVGTFLVAAFEATHLAAPVRHDADPGAHRERQAENREQSRTGDFPGPSVGGRHRPRSMGIGAVA